MGVRRSPIRAGEGSYDEIEYYPLSSIETVDDLDDIRWPSADWFEYQSLVDEIDNERSGLDRAIMVANGNIFESSWYMRGFERMFIDLVERPELASAVMDRALAFFPDYFGRILDAAAGRIDLVFTADDLGGQNGLLMSRNMWEQFIRPRHEELNRLIHSGGARVIYHTDGAVMEVVDGLIAAGVDVLQALQFDAEGMDPRLLKSRFGDELCFEGGVSVQKTLPFGTVDDVESEVRNLVDVLGDGGGYIFGPSHAIQAGTPPENIVAMFDTAVSCSSR